MTDGCHGVSRPIAVGPVAEPPGGVVRLTGGAVAAVAGLISVDRAGVGQ